MISRITGTLVAVDNQSIELRCGAITYQLLVPLGDLQRLSTQIDEDLELVTLQYLESQGQGSSYLPRLIGFNSAEDRAFFELFTTVKGLGNRKALRALQLPIGRIAEAIADKDIALLKTLPEIGKRTAETIIAELHGKVDRFIELKPGPVRPGSDPAATTALEGVIRDAVTVLTQLGESRADAVRLVERVRTADPSIETADELIAAAFRLREAG